MFIGAAGGIALSHLPGLPHDRRRRHGDRGDDRGDARLAADVRAARRRVPEADALALTPLVIVAVTVAYVTVGAPQAAAAGVSAERARAGPAGGHVTAATPQRVGEAHGDEQRGEDRSRELGHEVERHTAPGSAAQGERQTTPGFRWAPCGRWGLTPSGAAAVLRPVRPRTAPPRTRDVRRRAA